MPVNKNALLRYKTIDNCLRNTGRRWTLDNLIDACSDALNEFTGKDELVSKRTIQLDIQKMRSDELGYNAPIEVYDNKYYRYSEPNYSITNTPVSESDLKQMREAVGVLKQLSGFSGFSGMEDVVGRLEDHISSVRHERKPAIWFESNERLKGLNFITPLYKAIIAKQPVILTYQSFKSLLPNTHAFSPYILKEYRNRWFVFGRGPRDKYVVNLALDRIVDLRAAADESFMEDSSFDPETYFKDMIGVTKIPGTMDRETEVRFWASAPQVPYIETKPLHRSQMVIERNEDGSAIFQITVCLNYELEKSLLEFAEGIKVLKPKSLVSKIHRRLKSACLMYEH
ncbi:MAG: WYL domain-containing protein [Bacteroidales bacterium]|nr:WYL domain-containing protein [Candidatus Egerieousia equi]